MTVSNMISYKKRNNYVSSPITGRFLKIEPASEVLSSTFAGTASWPPLESEMFTFLFSSFFFKPEKKSPGPERSSGSPSSCSCIASWDLEMHIKIEMWENIGPGPSQVFCEFEMSRVFKLRVELSRFQTASRVESSFQTVSRFSRVEPSRVKPCFKNCCKKKKKLLKILC